MDPRSLKKSQGDLRIDCCCFCCLGNDEDSVELLICLFLRSGKLTLGQGFRTVRCFANGGVVVVEGIAFANTCVESGKWKVERAKFLSLHLDELEFSA